MTLAAMLLPLSLFPSAFFLLSYLKTISTYPRQRPTADIKGLIVAGPLWVFLCEEKSGTFVFLVFFFAPVVAEEIAHTWLVVAAPKDIHIGQKCTITAAQEHHRGKSGWLLAFFLFFIHSPVSLALRVSGWLAGAPPCAVVYCTPFA